MNGRNRPLPKVPAQPSSKVPAKSRSEVPLKVRRNFPANTRGKVPARLQTRGQQELPSNKHATQGARTTKTPHHKSIGGKTPLNENVSAKSHARKPTVHFLVCSTAFSIVSVLKIMFVDFY